MKNLRKSWRLVALFALLAVLSLTYVERTRAFTLIEIQYLPAVQVVAGQSAAVKVSNVSTASVDVVIAIFGGDGGTLLVSKTVSLAAGHTMSFPYSNTLTGNREIRAVVSLGTASAAVSDIETFDKTSGEVMVALPFLLLPAVE